MLSDESKIGIEERAGAVDSMGYIWDASSASYELKRQKWFDSEKDAPLVYYHEFDNEKIDLNKDGQKSDGRRVRIKGLMESININPKFHGKLMTRWVFVIQNRVFGSNTTYEGKYKYDFEKESFIKIDGYGPPPSSYPQRNSPRRMTDVHGQVA